MFYTTLKEGIIDTANMEFVVEAMYVPHILDNNNKHVSQGLKPSVILYQANQPIDLQL